MPLSPFWLLLPYAVWSWFNPRQGTLGLLALLPTYLWRASLGPLPTTWFELALYLTTLTTLVRWGWAPWRNLLNARHWRWFAPAALWLLAASLSAAVAPDKRLALGVLKGWVADPLLLAAAVVVVAQRTPNLRQLWRRAVAYLLIGASSASLVALAGLLQLGWSRQAAWYDSPNVLALYLVPVLVAGGLWLVWDWRALPAHARLAWGGGLLLVAAATISTGSYAALLSLTGALGVAALLTQFKQPKLRLAMAGGLVAVGLVLPWLAVGGGTWPLPSRRNEATGVTSGEVRLILWREATALIEQHPLLGVGLGQWQRTFAPRIAPGLPGALNPSYLVELHYASLFPHSLWLTTWLSLGLLGVAVLSYITVLVFQASAESVLPAAVLSAVLIHGMVDTPVFKNDLAVVLWLCFLAAAGTRALHRSAPPPYAHRTLPAA